MDKSTILMTMPGELRLDAHGRWVHDLQPVTHPGIADYLSKHLCWNDLHGRFVVEVEGRAVPVIIDDTAYFVVALDTSAVPWQIALNDGSSAEPLVGPIEVRASGEFICRVKGGRFPAKFGRNVHQQLQPFIEATGTSGNRYAVRTRTEEIQLVCQTKPTGNAD